MDMAKNATVAHLKIGWAVTSSPATSTASTTAQQTSAAGRNRSGTRTAGPIWASAPASAPDRTVAILATVPRPSRTIRTGSCDASTCVTPIRSAR